MPPSGTFTLTGTLRRAGDVPWTASSDPLAGQWRGAPPFPQVALQQGAANPGPWTGWWLPDELPRGLRSMAVQVNGPDVTMDAGPAFRFRGRLENGTLTGELTRPGVLPTPWVWTRIPDGILT